tara:strand:+ start:16407 stop:19142 length:2736 start_codon:yes stop_codon:yes gene_type:complete
MSIKTIDKQIKGSEGLAKKINKGAEKMVFDILQSTQYSTPIPSTIRELATNGADAQREKEIAIEILTGQAKAEDYYIERHGEQYNDSNFDISYYDLDHLDTENNDVLITYKENEGTGYCDVVSIKDYGVGIGERRLEGVLELGYSTKRNTAENFGAFGLGAKVALSTGVDFYTIETVHNGKRFKMNCYNYKTDFIIPAFNPGLGKPNPHIVLSDGTKVYYEDAKAKNQTIVSFGVKKHNRRDYRDAVEEQLMYMPSIRFKRIAEDGYERDEDIHPKIMHNSDNLIISNTYLFSKPHIVLTKDVGAPTGVNYGFVDFRELEMQQMWGPIAFKCPARQVINDPETGEEIVLQEGVDVTPSREKVIWNENTKAYIKSVIEAAADEASEIVQEELKQTDFVSWLLACKQVLTNADSGSVLGRLSNIIDQEQLKPKFGPDPRLKNESVKALFRGMKVEVITKSRDYSSGDDIIERNAIENYSQLRENNIFIMGEENHSKYKDMYLIHECDGPIICIKPIEDWEPSSVVSAESIKANKKALAKRFRVLQLITESTHSRNYDDIEVDEEWLEEYKDEIAKAKEIAQFENITPAERRKIEERMVAYTFRYNDKHWHASGSDKHYIRDKIEPKVKDLMKTQRTTYYGTAADDDKLMVACGMIHPFAPRMDKVYKDMLRWQTGDDDRVFFFDTPAVRFSNSSAVIPKTETKDDGTVYHNTNFDWDTPQIIRVSQSNVKHISMNPNVKHIDEFFLQLTPNGGYTMDEHAIKWYTADKMKSITDKTYLYCLKDINPDLFEKYKAVYNAADVDVRTSQWMKDTQVFAMVEKIVKMHNFCKDNDDAAAIQQKSRELFVIDVPEAVGQDQELMDKFDELEEWSKSVHTLLNSIEYIGYSPNTDQDLDQDLIKEIKVYLDAKGRLDW